MIFEKYQNKILKDNFMRTNQEYKNAALAVLRGRWVPAVIASVIYVGIIWCYLVPNVLSNFAVYGLLSIDLAVCKVLSIVPVFFMMLLVAPAGIGYANACLRLFREENANVAGNMVSYTFNGYWRNIWGVFLMRLFVSLWSLLLIIPGLIKYYSYALTPYLLKDFPELSANQCINLSIKMMKGHKLDLFCLYLSFVGWIMLAVFTGGIGLLWLVPYMSVAEAAFYQDVKAAYIK